MLRRRGGFTLVELMIVLTLIAILASIAIPLYMKSTVKAREAVLLEDLYQMRKAIDNYYGDNGAYPSDLSILADKKYIRTVPVDPFTNSNETWVLIYSDEGDGVFDVKSGSDGTGKNGTLFSDW
ncbi:MAG: prepilin-type N-terminal cleavage/methylation domain-containing protein [Deltaproteobacteria bacterium]|nr:prepilin-type N-terminal cleavage/methylation domain-containing protein [Deltaproteobacteria bacterium]